MDLRSKKHESEREKEICIYSITKAANVSQLLNKRNIRHLSFTQISIALFSDSPNNNDQ